MTNLIKRFSDFGVLVALVVTSGLAYVWPVLGLEADPFRLPSFGLLALVALTMFCLGLVVQSSELDELKRRPAMVLLGVVVQCTLMPLLAYWVVLVLSLDGPIASGVILCGCVPGAMASNVLTMTAKGNVSYSVSLTTVATLLSPLTVPLALALIAGFGVGGDAFDPFEMAKTLAMTVVVPVIAGYVLKQKLGFAKDVFLRIAPWIATIALLWIIAFVVAGNRGRLVQVAPLLLGGLLMMNLLGYVGGYWIGRLFKMPASMNRALTLEVGMQNAGLGTALAANLLGADSLAQIPTAAYTFGCMLTGTMLASVWASNKPCERSSETTV